MRLATDTPRRALRTPIAVPPPYQHDWESIDKVLGVIRHYGPITVADLGREVLLSYRQITRSISALRERGVVREVYTDLRSPTGPRIAHYEVCHG